MRERGRMCRVAMWACAGVASMCCGLAAPVAFAQAVGGAGERAAEAERSEQGAVVAERLASIERLTERLAAEFEGERSVKSLVRQSHAAYVSGGYERAAALARFAQRVAREQAERDDRSAEEVVPIEAPYNEGVALLEVGAVDAAEDAFRYAAAMPVEGRRAEAVKADASMHLGLIALRAADAAVAEEQPDALDPVARILELEPEQGWSDYDAVMQYLIDGYLESGRHFERSLEVRPAHEATRRNLQIARLRAGELNRMRYEARLEFDELLSKIVRPQELIQETVRLADAQGAAAEGSEERLDDLRRASEQEWIDASLSSIDEQAPINADTERMFQRSGLTRRVLEERVIPANPMLGRVLESLLEEFELGLRDAVESQRWSVFEFDRSEVGEGAALQRQAERDLREVLEKLQQSASQFQRQASQQQQERSEQAAREREEREERAEPQADNDQRAFEEGRRDRTVQGILTNEREDLERVRESRREAAPPVKKDW